MSVRPNWSEGLLLILKNCEYVRINNANSAIPCLYRALALQVDEAPAQGWTRDAEQLCKFLLRYGRIAAGIG